MNQQRPLIKEIKKLASEVIPAGQYAIEDFIASSDPEDEVKEKENKEELRKC